MIGLAEPNSNRGCNDYDLDLTPAQGVFEVLESSLRCNGNNVNKHKQKIEIKASGTAGQGVFEIFRTLSDGN